MTVPSFCDVETGACYHGTSDGSCEGVPNLSSYEGMEETFEGSDMPTFCWLEPAVGPLRMAECPPLLQPSETTTAAKTCHEGCMYDGCLRPDFDVPAYCDEKTGTCYHGVSDAKCDGIDDADGYPGIQPLEGSDKPAFCWSVETAGPLRMAECPDPTPNALTTATPIGYETNGGTTASEGNRADESSVTPDGDNNGAGSGELFEEQSGSSSKISDTFVAMTITSLTLVASDLLLG
mmetsp:Transcript_24450/g.45200  ORF Transcript_24450/g.45200 Transcript_24450/m.45200 type:complete len:235 (+) Transcript_24450:2386-3090(+)